MTQYQAGADALNSLNNTGDSGNKTEFASFKSGTKYKVRVLGTADLIRFYSYGIYKKVNSFVAANPSKKNANGFPVDALTPWDKAWQYLQDQKKAAEDAGDNAKAKALKDEAAKYRVKERYALGFIDVTTGAPIIVDLSKKQAQGIHAVIKKFESKLGKVAFELTKQGKDKSTIVSLTPFIDMDEDLDAKERENFTKYDGKAFDMALFDGLLYEADEKEQIESLVAAGFDISQIGLTLGGGNDVTGDEIPEDQLPF